MPPKKTAQRRSRKETLEEELLTLIRDEQNTNDEEVLPVLQEAFREGVDLNLVVDDETCDLTLLCHFAHAGMLRCFEECFLLGAALYDPDLTGVYCDPVDRAITGNGTTSTILRMITILSTHKEFNDLDNTDSVRSACRLCLFDVVKFFLRRDEDSYSQEVLFAGIDAGSVKLVQLAIEHGADVNDVNSEEKTPVHLAAQLFDADVMQLLIKHGADAEEVDSLLDETPLVVAIKHGSVNCAKFLMRKRKSVELDVILDYVIRYRRSEILEEFLVFADVKKYVKEESPKHLTMAIANNDFEAFKVLYSLGKIDTVPILQYLVRLSRYEMLSCALFDLREDVVYSDSTLTKLLQEAPAGDLKTLLQTKIDALRGVGLASTTVKKEYITTSTTSKGKLKKK